MANTLAKIGYDGSKPLKNNTHERYARFRAQALPRIVAFRKAGNVAKNDCNADANSFRLEKKPGVRERIDYLVGLAQDRIAEKRAALEERLWGIHEADIGDFFETFDVAKSDTHGKLETGQNGKMLTVKKQRPRLLSDLSAESRKLIEEVVLDRNGNFVPRLYSKAEANRELRKLHGIDRQEQPKTDDVSRLSDAELIQQLSDQAKELGIEIDLNYSFLQQAPATEAPDLPAGETIEHEPVAAEAQPSATDAAAADAARDLKIGLNPAVAGARPARKAR